MGWFGDFISNGGGFLGGVGAGLAGLAIGQKNSYNNNIDQQINSNQMGMPTAIDPNSLPSASPGYLQQANNYTQSPWASMQLGKNSTMTGQAVDAAAAKSASGTAGAESNLASHGGLTGGAAEGLQRAGMQDSMLATQDAQRQGNVNALDIGAKDADLGLQKAGTWANLAEQENAQKSALMENNYTNQMQAWAANQTANSQLASTKKTGLLGLGFGPL